MNKQNRNTKKAMKALIVVGVVLVLTLVGAIVYFYALKDQEDQDYLSQITCGCYMVDPAVISECGDPKRAFLFNLNTVSSDQTCNAKCDINDIADNLLNSTTPRDSFKSCTVRSISDTRCENMILKDGEGKIITGRIDPTNEINVEATFDKSTYTDYIFKVNTESIIPDKVDGNKITKTLSDFEGLNLVEIIATAKDVQGEQINSIVCRRVVDIQTTASTSVTNMTAMTEQQVDGKTKISLISISVGQLTSENVKIRFSFTPTFSTIVASDGILVEPTKGSITMTKLDLYDESNFSSGSFNILNSHLGDLTILADVFVDEISIGSANTTVKFVDTSTPSDEEPEEPPQEEPISDSNKSNFSVTKTVAQSCVERTVGNNLAIFTVNIQNRKSVTDSITSVKDKLPLGFTYTSGSTTIDGATVSDSPLVNVTTIGDSQEIVWQPTTPWDVPANGNLSISFHATATSSAISGYNLNEVVATPLQIPLDSTTLRSQVSLTVAQDCENVTEEEAAVPSTGIFDNFAVRMVLGILILLTGWLVYIRPEGNRLSEIIINSRAYDDFELTKYRVTNPKKYFEKKILRNKSKGNQ